MSRTATVTMILTLTVFAGLAAVWLALSGLAVAIRLVNL